MKNSTTVINQNELVINYLKRNSRRSLTSEQICQAVNGIIRENIGKRLYPRNTKMLTTTQVSKCLNRFNVKNMVKQVDRKGEFSNGVKAIRWGYVRPQ